MFQVIPYLVRFPDCIPVTSLMDKAELVDVQIRLENFPLADEPSEFLMNKLPFKSSSCLYPTISSCYQNFCPSQLRQSYLLSISQPNISPLGHFSVFSFSYVSCSRLLCVK